MIKILSGIVSFFIISAFLLTRTQTPDNTVIIPEKEKPFTVAGIVQSNETLDSIFTKLNLSKRDLVEIYNKALNQYNLSNIAVGNVYAFELDRTENTIKNMQYGIDDLSFLNVTRNSDGFSAERITHQVSSRASSINISIEGNLISSMPGQHREYVKMALSLAEIYAWDIDFSNDIRNGDSLKLIIEELWVGDVFKGYGNILAAEFTNKKEKYSAYRYEHEGYVDYFDEKGQSLKKALLRSPLNFKYISSGFSKRRLHPILGRHRPHLGIDYAAPKGTPVSSAGNGTIMFAGYKGQNGKMVKVKHPGGYTTYYGHLSRIPKKIRKGRKVSQGDIIGYVGSTGLSTGPHLDYRIKYKGKFVNPLKISLPRGKSVPVKMMDEFARVVTWYNARLSEIPGSVVASAINKGTQG